MSFLFLQFFQKTNEKQFDLRYRSTVRSKFFVFFVRFLEELKRPKFPFEINWPLATQEKGLECGIRTVPPGCQFCNVWLGLELRWIFSWKAVSDLNSKNVARPTTQNSVWPANFGFEQLRQFFNSLKFSQVWKFQTLQVDILSSWCTPHCFTKIWDSYWLLDVLSEIQNTM